MTNWATKTVTLRLNDFMYNAGVSGLLTVLKNDGVDECGNTVFGINTRSLANDNTIEIPFSAFDGFAKRYVGEMVKKYGRATEFFVFKNTWEEIDNDRDEPNIDKKLFLIDFVRSIKASSILTGFRALSDSPFTESIRLIEFDEATTLPALTDKDEFTKAKKEFAKAKKMVATNGISEMKAKAAPLFARKPLVGEEKDSLVEEIFDEYRPLFKSMIDGIDVFFMKKIAYSVINRFWSGISFLSMDDGLLSIPADEAYQKTFIEPLIKHFETPVKPKAPKKGATGPEDRILCLQCHDRLGTHSKLSFSWVEGLGIDSAKKTSSFWNNMPDDDMCPVCALVYSCIPLGFTFDDRNQMAIFANCSFSINGLVELNATTTEKIASGNELVNKGYSKYATMVNKYMEQESMYGENQVRLGGIQFIRKGLGSRFSLDLVTPQQMQVFSKYRKDFEFLAKVSFKDDKGEWYSVYEHLVSDFFSGKSLHFMIDSIIRNYLQGNVTSPGFLDKILNIEDYHRLIKKGDVNVKMENTTPDASNDAKLARNGEKKPFDFLSTEQKELFFWRRSGEDIRAAFDPDRTGEIDNKIRGYAYRLSNSIRMGDTMSFIDEMSRAHIRYEVDMPRNAERLWYNTDEFTRLGQAYLIGLISGRHEKKIAENGNGGTANA
jgi:CRISPR-associated protein Cst1